MVKRIFIIIVLLLVTVYLGAAFTVLNRKPSGRICQEVKVIVKDSANTSFITSSEVITLLKKKRLYPKEVLMDSICSKEIELELEKNPFVESAECYKTPMNVLCIQVNQRVPILRVMNTSGESYYIDSQGEVIPNAGSPAHLAVATGYIDKGFAMNELYQFALMLRKDPFWEKQIEQINVTSDRELELVPRVGDHILFLGKSDNVEEKLSKLKVFYRKGLNQVGWNKYSRISLEFDNQVICKRKEK